MASNTITLILASFVQLWKRNASWASFSRDKLMEQRDTKKQLLRYNTIVLNSTSLSTIPSLFHRPCLHTSPYQGIIAGINAALSARHLPPFVLGRADAYIGV